MISRLGRIIVLVGKNDAGKSNILDAIRCFFLELTNMLGGESNLHDLIWPNLEREGDSLFQVKVKIPSSEILDRFDENHRVAFRLKIPGQTWLVDIKRKLDAHNRKWETSLVEVNSIPLVEENKTIINMYENDGTVSTSHGTYFASTRDFVEALFHHCRNQISWIDLDFRDSKKDIHFQGKRQSIVPDIVLDTIFSWHTDLNSNNIEKMNKLRQLFKIFTGGSDIRQDGKVLRIVERKFNPPIESVGSGKQQLLTLCFNLLMNRKVILIEEPESHFHPSLMRNAFKALQEFSDKEQNQLIMTTHSSVFLNQASFADIWLIRKNRSHNTQCKRVVASNDFDNIAEELGLRPSDVGMVNALLFVEGICDKVMISKWCSLLDFPLESPFVHVVVINGKNGEKHKARTWKPVVEAFPTLKMGWVFDSDMSNRDFDDLQRIIGKRHKIWRFNKGSIEDYYPIDLLKGAIIEHVGMSTRQCECIQKLDTGSIVKKIDDILGKDIGWKVPVARKVAKSSRKEEDIPIETQNFLKLVISFLR